MSSIRYFVADVVRSADFYTRHLGFRLEKDMRPAIAMVQLDDLTLWLSGPESSAARPMPDARKPEPGGWNRLVVEVPDLADVVTLLRGAGVRFRNDIVTGPGGKQIVLEDPDGNPVELFQPADAPVGAASGPRDNTG